MAKTTIANLLTPANWTAYQVVPTAEKSAFWASGIVGDVAGITLPQGGGTVNLPFFQDLSGDEETLSDASALSVGNIAAASDVAAVIGRGRAFSVNDLAAVLSGADPLRAIMELLDRYQQRQAQKELINMLGGAFAAASMAGNVSDISAGASEAVRAINQTTFLDAGQLLGDAKEGIVAVAMHSAVETYLSKQQMIVYETTADKSERIARYLGKRVIVDDGLPVSSGTYTTYLFGAGAIGFSQDAIGEDDIETDRDILAGDTVATYRRRFILHPRGIKWQGTPAGNFPTRAELATGTNWARVYENKQIRIVQFKHKIA
jgi:hypothetical protein